MSSWRILAGAAACVVALAGILAPAAAGTNAETRATPSTASCAAITSPYGTAKSLLRACGYSIYPLRRVITNPDRSKTYVYNLNGTRVTSMVPPPPHFNPFKASNAQLKRYGLPPKDRSWPHPVAQPDEPPQRAGHRQGPSSPTPRRATRSIAAAAGRATKPTGTPLTTRPSPLTMSRA